MEFPETTLSSPLSDHLAKSVATHLARPELINESIRSRSTNHDSLPRNLAISLRNCYHDLVLKSAVIHTGFWTPKLVGDTSLWGDVIPAATKSLGTVLDITRGIGQGLNKGLTSLVSDISHLVGNEARVSLPTNLSEDCTRLYCRAAAWQQLVTLATGPDSRGASWVKFQTHAVNRHVTAYCLTGQLILIPHDALLMIKDMVWGRFLTRLMSELIPRKGYCEMLHSFVWGWAMEGLEELGDRAYNIIKSLETFCTLRLIELSEEILDVTSQVSFMTAEVGGKEIAYRKELRLKHTEPKLVTDLWAFLATLSDPNQVAECFSLLKTSGHPYISPVAGSQAIEKLAKAETTAEYKGVKAVAWSFCHMFTKGYVDKMKRWPPLVFNFPDNRKSRLRDMYEQNYSPLPLGLSLYDPADWDFCTFLPVDEFDYGENILSLITDKSLSYKRSEIDNSWAGRLDYSPPKPTSSTRVVEQLLKEDVDMKEVCRLVSEDELPYDWYVVTIHPKEREMKWWVARMFAIMVLQPRLFFCLLEKNLAEKLFPYIPEQTMTMTQAQEDDFFLNVSQSSDNYTTLAITIDLSKWCSHFRQFSVEPIADRLNQLLGVVGLYGFVHEFFKRSLIVLRHPAFTPTQPTKGLQGHLVEEPGIYMNAEAGLEGIQQKTWTLVTLCMLHWAVWRFGCSYKITCQGDNLVIYFTISRVKREPVDVHAERVRSLNKRVLLSISEAARMIGHDVRPDECFSSTSFITYGKNMWFKGRKLETALKVATRMFPKTTADTPSTEGIISNIAATGTSMVERLDSPLEAFLFTKFVENLVIDREMKQSIVHQGNLGKLKNSRVWTAHLEGGRTLLTLCPRNLGGLPVSTLAEFLYRGHSDPLSSSLGSLALFTSIPIVNKYLACLELESFVGLDPDGKRDQLIQLIRDPYSVPMPSLSSGSLISTTRNVRMTLKRLTKNRLLKPIIAISVDSVEEKKLLTTLLTMVPFNPIVAHDIMDKSAFGLADSISRRFTGTKTLRRITNNSEIDLITSQVLNDKERIRSVLDRLSKVQVISKRVPTIPTHSLLILMRSRWGLPHMEGVTNYHPLVAGKLILTHLTPLELTSRLVEDPSQSLMVVMSLTSRPSQLTSTRGSVPPYLGNETSEKVVEKYVKPIRASPPLQDALRLIQLAKLCSTPESNLRITLESLATQRTSLPLDLLYNMAKEQAGGTVSHRLRSLVAARGSRLACLPNISTHLSVSSNLSRQMGQVDYPISYGEFYLMLTSLFPVFFPQDVKPPFGLMMVVDLKDLSPLEDKFSELSAPYRPRQVLETGYYLRCDTVQLTSRERYGNLLPENVLSGKATNSVIAALATVMLSEMTRGLKMVRKPGYVRSATSYKKIVDLPEAEYISKQEYLEAASLAVAIYSSQAIIGALNKQTAQALTVEKILLQNSLLLSPQIFQTISCSGENDDPLLRQAIGSAIPERSIIHLACSITARGLEDIQSLPPLYEKGLESFSAGLSARLQLLTLRLILKGEAPVSTGKFVSRLVRKLQDRGTEESRVSGLFNLVTVLHLGHHITLTGDSPQARLRQLRTTERTPPGQERLIEPYHLAPPAGRPVLTDCPLSFSDDPYHLSKPQLVRSWSMRPPPGISDSRMKWAPLPCFLSPSDTLYIVGIGAGGILDCIPDHHTVFGVDLPITLQCLGQNFVNYSASVPHPRYHTRPISWLRNLQDLTERDMSELIADIIDSRADTVVLDMDRVPLRRRVLLRNKITRAGLKCWARLFGPPEAIVQATASIAGSCSSTDHYWIPEISVGSEVIYGPGDWMDCEKTAVGEFESPIVKPTRRELDDADWICFVWALGGSRQDTGRLREFVHKPSPAIGGTAPSEAYRGILGDPGMVDVYGRHLSRLVLCFVGELL